VIATGGFYGSPFYGFVLLPGHCFVLYLPQLILRSNEEHEVAMYSVQERVIELSLLVVQERVIRHVIFYYPDAVAIH
jgi:hypothetical protein